MDVVRVRAKNLPIRYSQSDIDVNPPLWHLAKMELGALVYGNSDGPTKKTGMAALRFLFGESLV